jgi:hypothetical protein
MQLDCSTTKTRLAPVFAKHSSTRLVIRGPAQAIIVEAVYNNQSMKSKEMFRR